MPGRATDLETLKAIFRDDREWLTIARVTQTDMAKDRSVFRVKVEPLDEPRPIICRLGANAVGPNAGDHDLPEVGDLALIAFPDADEDYATVIRFFTSREDAIPTEADTGKVIAARLGKILHLLSQERINIGKSGASATEPLVLGEVLKTFLASWLDVWLNAPQIGQHPLGPVFLDPAVRTQLTALKSQYLTTASTNILSQLGFTERGD